MLRLLRAKLHRARVTDARVDYVGSITIDASLLSIVGLLPLEEVDVVNVTTGARWSTYALPGAPGSGTVCPNGGGARLAQTGDVLVIFAYAGVERAGVSGHEARVAVLDERNRVIQQRLQTLSARDGGLRWSEEVVGEVEVPSDAVRDHVFGWSS